MKIINTLCLIVCIISFVEFILYCNGLYTPSRFAVGVDMFNTAILFLLFSFAKFGVVE